MTTLIKSNFLCVPLSMEENFKYAVLNQYNQLIQKRVTLSELDISERIVDLLNQISTTEIFEDGYSYDGHYEFELLYMFEKDVEVYLLSQNLIFYSDHTGVFHHYPSRKVW